MSKNKTAIAIALFLMATITVTLVALPAANAHDPPWEVLTWCYMGIAPDVSGVNQEVIIVFWINMVPPTANGAYGDRWSFNVNVVKPNGDTETLGPFTSDPVGGGWTTYTPDQIGNYTFKAIFPGKTIDNTPGGFNPGYTRGQEYLGDTYLTSESEPVTLIVQEEQIPSYEETPLPTGYWSRPIYGANHLWGQIAGQWLGGGDTPELGPINYYSTGPSTSHINWAVPFWSGGTMGGGASVNFGSIEYYSGQQYENYGGPYIVLDGKVYYTVNQPPREGYYCISLYTGETLYFRNTTGAVSGASGGRSGSIPYGAPAFGQVYDYESPNQHGGFPYLWVTSTGTTGQWDMLDGHTGNYICSIANVTQRTQTAGGSLVTTGATGTSKNDNTGSICYYNLVNLGTNANPDMYLQIWNTSQTIWWYNNMAGSNVYWEWRPYLNFTFDGSHGFSLNASIPAVEGSIRRVVTDKYIIGGTTGNITDNPNFRTDGNLWALNLDRTKGDVGSLLWNFDFTPPAGLPDTSYGGGGFGHNTAFGGLSTDEGIFWYTNSMLRTYYVYSLDASITGKPQGTLLWTSDPVSQWGFYGLGTTVYHGRLYNTNGYTGILIAYNATTGHIDWTWSAPSVGYDETPYTHTPLYVASITEDKMYLFSSEHSVGSPIRRDAQLWCVDLTSGMMLWSITCWPSNDPIRSTPIIADGRLLVADIQDCSIYCFGPGSSKTTVSAPQIVPALGSSVTITGTVTDNTDSGRHNTNGELDFSLKGTPAISDADMDAWMEYMYHQRPMPKDAKGVEVVLETFDPNGNFYEIGNTTSDVTGAYACLFTPEVPGMYQIIATFKGSGAYSGSFAQTYLSVGEAPQTTPTAPPPEPSMADLYFVPGIIGVIIAIVAVGLVLLLVLRKR
jgi:hypothetical protein